MKIFHKIFLLWILLFVYAQKVNSQESLSDIRNRYFFTYRFGIAEDKAVREFAKSSNTFLIGKSFAVHESFSLNPTISYSHVAGNNLASLGGDISIYPRYFAALILKNQYDPMHDRLFVNIGLQKIMMKNDYTLVFNADANLFSLNINKRLDISPKIGYQHFIPSISEVEGLVFYTFGVSFLLK